MTTVDRATRCIIGWDVVWERTVDGRMIMKLRDLKPAEVVCAEQLAKSPALREERDRTALARAVARRVVAYRAEHGVTQTELARRLGLRQSAVARLEAGEHEPTLATLALLARRLDMQFHLDITADTFSLAG